MRNLQLIIVITLILGLCTYYGCEKTGDLIPAKKKEDKSGLFPIVQDKKWGYINNKGEIKINPQFDNGGEFSEGLAAVVIGGNVGYIDETGKITINPQFRYDNDLYLNHVGYIPRSLLRMAYSI